MQHLVIGFVCGILSVAAILYLVWLVWVLNAIHAQVAENAYGINSSIKNQESIAGALMNVVKEFKETISYQRRVMEELIDVHFRRNDDGESQHEQQ